MSSNEDSSKPLVPTLHSVGLTWSMDLAGRLARSEHGDQFSGVFTTFTLELHTAIGQVDKIKAAVDAGDWAKAQALFNEPLTYPSRPPQCKPNNES